MVAVFLLDIAAEIPFMNASYPKFEGPAASAMSGADISWLVGFVVAAALYYLAVRTARSATAPEPAAAGSLPGSA
jgi:NCS1 family nucleobase:cation symporter-1